MADEGESLVFQRVTSGIRKPVVRFGLPSGRRVELLAFHLEPGWAFGGGAAPRHIAHDVVKRLYPHGRPVFVTEPEQATGPAWLCVAQLCSDTPTESGAAHSNYSVLLVCGLIRDVSVGVRGIVCELLSRVDWDTAATDDMMW